MSRKTRPMRPYRIDEFGPVPAGIAFALRQASDPVHPSLVRVGAAPFFVTGVLPEPGRGLFVGPVHPARAAFDGTYEADPDEWQCPDGPYCKLGHGRR